MIREARVRYCSIKTHSFVQDTKVLLRPRMYTAMKEATDGVAGIIRAQGAAGRLYALLETRPKMEKGEDRRKGRREGKERGDTVIIHILNVKKGGDFLSRFYLIHIPPPVVSTPSFPPNPTDNAQGPSSLPRKPFEGGLSSRM